MLLKDDVSLLPDGQSLTVTYPLGILGAILSTLITTFETGISGVEAQAADAVDQQVLCIDGRGGTACSHQAVS